MCATSGAFDLHARVRIRAVHRDELERLARYLEHLGLDTEGYEPLQARAPPQLDLAL